MKNSLLSLTFFTISILSCANSLSMDNNPKFEHLERKKQELLARLPAAVARLDQAHQRVLSSSPASDLSTQAGLAYAVAQFKQKIQTAAALAHQQGEYYVPTKEDWSYYTHLQSAYNSFLPQSIHHAPALSAITPASNAINAPLAIQNPMRPADQNTFKSLLSYRPTPKHIGIGMIAAWASVELCNAYRNADKEKWEKAGYFKPMLLFTQTAKNILKRPVQFISLLEKKII